MKLRHELLAFAMLSLGHFSTSLAATNGFSFETYGFIQADYIQDFGRVNPAWEDALRPSRIPTTEGAFGSDGQASISIKQSRFGVIANIPAGDKTLKTKFEFDLFGVGVDEGQTTIRPRHIYGEWGKLLVGQTNSLFMDGDIFPNVVEYWGPSGMVFLRTPQMRWTAINNEDWRMAVAIEHAKGDIDPGQIRDVDPGLGANIKADEKLPDLTAQARRSWGWGYLQLGGILRSIGYETIGAVNNEPNGHRTGWGLDLSSTVNIGQRDKIKLSVVNGAGIANYMNDGGTDLAPDGAPGDVSAKAVPLLGVMAYYDHYWSDEWSSSVGYSFTQVDNTALQTADAFEKGEYASINLLQNPYKNILMGLEVQWGRRTDNDGRDGDDLRSQISVKYDFSSNFAM